MDNNNTGDRGNVLFETDVFDWQSFDATKSRVFNGNGVVFTLKYPPGPELRSKLGGITFGRAKLTNGRPSFGSLGSHILEPCEGYEGDSIRYFVLPKIPANVEVVFTEGAKSNPNKLKIFSNGTKYTLSVE